MHFNNPISNKMILKLLGCLSITLLLNACGNSEDAQKLKDALEVNTLDISSLQLSSPNTVVEFDATEQFIAEAVIGDGSGAPLDVSNKVTWSVSDTSAASINSSGLLTGKADALVTVTAKLADLSASKDLMLSSATLSTINIVNTPSPISVCQSGYVLSAEGVYSDATTRDVTDIVTWSSDDTSTLAINNTNEFSTFKNGSATISATRNSISGTETITVNDDIASILIESTSTDVNIDSTLTFTATGTYDDASSANITNNVTWSSDDTANLTISNNDSTKGVATGVAVGTANISATCATTVATVSNVVEITVSEPPVIDDIAINDGIDDIEFKINDSPEQLTAKLQFNDDTLSTDVTDDDNTTWRVDDTISGTPLEISDIKGSKGEITFSAVGITRVEVVYSDSDSDFGTLTQTILVKVIEN